jgi:hypothetical protein
MSAIASLVLGTLFLGTPPSVPHSFRTPVDRASVGVHFGIPNNPTEESYLSSLREQVRVGTQGLAISAKWNELEPAQGRYALKKVDDSVGLAKFIGGKSLFTFQTIDTNNWVLPQDLTGLRFDDPKVIGRASVLLNKVLTSLGQGVKWISLGNEVDVYLVEHPEELPEYLNLLRALESVVRRERPDLKVGVTVTFDGLVRRPEVVSKFAKFGDCAVVTYYPMKEDFSPLPLATTGENFDRMMSFAGGRPLVLQEIGLPSATLLGSSEALQAEFVSAIFRQLETRKGIDFASFFMQYEFPTPMLDFFESYYGLKNERFRAFLGSLGFHDPTGNPKPSWKRFVQEMQKWNPM